MNAQVEDELNMDIIAISEKSGRNQQTLLEHQNAVEKVVLTMQKTLECPLSLHQLAEIACLSSSRFSRVFHGVTGLPPVKFYSLLRMREARRLLQTTDVNITELCFELGYSSLSSFSRDFTHHIGMSPRIWRKTSTSLEELPGWQPTIISGSYPSVLSGHVFAPSSFMEGLIFIGLFQDPVPSSFPVGCAILNKPGEYHIACTYVGSAYLFAAAFELSAHLTGNNDILAEPSYIGTAANPAQITPQRELHGINILLLPISLTHPPMLFALPLLIAQQSKSFISGKTCVDNLSICL